MAELHTETQTLRRRTRRILGITVLLTQLPLVLHLPLWISIPGMALVLSKIIPTFDNKNLITPLVMTPLVLLAALGIIFHYGHFFDRDPCVAFLFLLVGFKFAESKRVYDASLLIVLCAFLLMTQFFYWQSIAAALFSIPAIFFIGLSLFSLQRGAAEMGTRSMVHMTSKLLLQAIPVAMVLFVAVPRITTQGAGNSGQGNATTGLSSRMSSSSISGLTKSNEVAFRVEFNSGAPTPWDLYWRGPVLTGYDGQDWFILPTRASHYLPQPKLQQAGRSTQYTVTMEATHNPWLLALDTPVSLPTQTLRNGNIETIAQANNERQLNSLKPLNRVTQYQTTSLLLDRFKPSLAPGAENLLTTESNPRAQAWARKQRAAHPNDMQFINHVMRWFNTENFSYTLNPPATGRHSIDDFIFNTRSGFCEHYAGSFVLMLRAAGIPARVVTGYQGGEYNGDYMIVRQSDAHAWAEAYIDGEWIRFDPTAAVAPERVEQGLNDALSNELNTGILGGLEFQWVKSAQLKWDSVNYAWQQIVIGFDSATQNEFWKKLGFEKPSALKIVLLVLVAGLFWIGLILLPSTLFNRTRLDPCETQWQKFCRKFARKGHNRNPGESPRNYVNRLAERWPQHRRSMQLLLAAYHAGRFSEEAQQKKIHSRYANDMKVALQQIGKGS